MSIHLVIGKANGTDDAAVMFDSVTGWAFGPVFKCGDDAEHFITFVQAETGHDPRAAEPVHLEMLRHAWVVKRKGSLLTRVMGPKVREDACCDNEDRNMNGGCNSCGAPCL